MEDKVLRRNDPERKPCRLVLTTMGETFLIMRIPWQHEVHGDCVAMQSDMKFSDHWVVFTPLTIDNEATGFQPLDEANSLFMVN